MAIVFELLQSNVFLVQSICNIFYQISEFCGCPPISEADLTKRLNSLKNNTYLQDHLEVVQRSKQKTLLKLAKLEEMEEALNNLIAQQQ